MYYRVVWGIIEWSVDNCFSKLDLWCGSTLHSHQLSPTNGSSRKEHNDWSRNLRETNFDRCTNRCNAIRRYVPVQMLVTVKGSVAKQGLSAVLFLFVPPTQPSPYGRILASKHEKWYANMYTTLSSRTLVSTICNDVHAFHRWTCMKTLPCRRVSNHSNIW